MPRRTALSLLIFALATLSFASIAFGQKKSKVLAERSVSGAVLNSDGQPVAGAVVQLKNTKSLEVRSFIAKEKGEYYFHSLSTDVDYELKAEWNGKASNTRTLSAFDSHTEIVANLQLK